MGIFPAGSFNIQIHVDFFVYIPTFWIRIVVQTEVFNTEINCFQVFGSTGIVRIKGFRIPINVNLFVYFYTIWIKRIIQTKNSEPPVSFQIMKNVSLIRNKRTITN